MIMVVHDHGRQQTQQHNASQHIFAIVLTSTFTLNFQVPVLAFSLNICKFFQQFFLL